MVYKVIGLMSGSSLDGLDIAYVELQESAGKWEFNILHTACYAYTEAWKERLRSARGLSALDYQQLHTEYGHYLGGEVNRFVDEHGLHYRVQLIASHGHTAFHVPALRLTAQLGDGAALAAETKINVVSDLRAMDLALGGQGAPIVPIGEKLLWRGYDLFLNLGGIANITAHGAVSGPGTGGSVAAIVGGSGGGASAAGKFVAFDVCPANRVLNELVSVTGAAYDADGRTAAGGNLSEALLNRLNALEYYGRGYPKSLANEFGTDVVLPMIRETGLPVAAALRTYTEHIAIQVGRAVEILKTGPADDAGGGDRGSDGGSAEAVHRQMLVTGGGAHNGFLIDRLRERLAPLGVEVVIPDKEWIDYKEALVMALIGVLRWREENNVLASVTGAERDSIGGAVWIGQEA